MTESAYILTDSEKKKFYRSMVTMVLPMAFQNFMSAAVSASDAVMLGFLRQEALSAVSLAGQIFFVFNLFMIILTVGTTMLAAQYWGKGDRTAVEKILGLALKLSFAVALCFFIATRFFPELLMRVFTSEAELVGMGAQYLKTVGPSYLFIGISHIYLCIMKNSGKTARSTVIGSSAMILNILFNYVLIFGALGIPAMGITGAALATVLARLLEMIWTLAESFRKDSLKIRGRYLLRIDRELQADYIKYLLPVTGNYLVFGIGFTMYTVIMGHMGGDAVAANSIAAIVKNLVICVCSGVSTAGGILVGNEFGKHEISKGIAYANRVTGMAAVCGVCSGLLILALNPVIVNFARLSPDARGYLRGMLFMCSYYMVGKSINSTVIGGIFCAGGDAKFGLRCDTVVLWLIMIPLGLLSAFYWKLPVLAVYFILSMDEFLKIPPTYIHYKKYTWAQDLTRKD